MFNTPWQIDATAAYTRQRIAEEVAACRLAAAARGGRVGQHRVALAWLLRGIGRGLIAAGERLAGPATPRRVTTAGQAL